MREWQPIETAPKDGTRIDVWQYCHNSEWRPNPKDCGIENGWRYADIYWEDGEWQQMHDNLGEGVSIEFKHHTISHWMPLPAAPK